MTVVQLGHRGVPSRAADDLHQRLYHLPDAGMIVVVECRVHDGWRCGVIAAHGGGARPGHIALRDSDLVHARRTIAVDPVTEPDLFALLWQTRIAQRWRGASIHRVARALAESLRPPGCLFIDIDPPAVRHLHNIAHLRPPALRLFMARLTDAGMLTADLPGCGRLGTYLLTLPELPGSWPRPVNPCSGGEWQ